MRDLFSNDEELSVEAVNVERGIARMSDGSTREITNMFDADGDDTEDPVAAVACVVKDREDRWLTLDLCDFLS